MLFFYISRNFGKLVKNLKEYKTKLYFTIKVPVIEIDNDFNHRNFNRVSETFKVQDISIFGKLSVRQTVRSAKCPFGKTSVRQNVRRQNVRSAKCPATKLEHLEKTHDFRQSVDRLFSHESVVRIEPTISDVKAACSDHCATEAPLA
jgi:hypothetical protein